MARPLPPPPLNGLAISGGIFFAASLTHNSLLFTLELNTQNLKRILTNIYKFISS